MSWRPHHSQSLWSQHHWVWRQWWASMQQPWPEPFKMPLLATMAHWMQSGWGSQNWVTNSAFSQLVQKAKGEGDGDAGEAMPAIGNSELARAISGGGLPTAAWEEEVEEPLEVHVPSQGQGQRQWGRAGPLPCRPWGPSSGLRPSTRVPTEEWRRPQAGAATGAPSCGLCLEVPRSLQACPSPGCSATLPRFFCQNHFFVHLSQSTR